MTINIPHPECPTCNPKCPCCGTPIKAAPKPTVNPDPMQPFGPWVQPTYPVPFNPYPPSWPWDGWTSGTVTFNPNTTGVYIQTNTTEYSS